MGFFLVVSAVGAFLLAAVLAAADAAAVPLLVSGSESSSSLDEMELFESFCCFRARDDLSFVASGLLFALFAALPISELRRLTILSLAFGTGATKRTIEYQR